MSSGREFRDESMRLAVVVPCFRVKEHILDVLAGIPSEVSKIYVIDDACPDGSGDFAKANTSDSRLEFIFHEENKGVGGATISGYRKAHSDGADVVIKIDGDGQMDLSQIPRLLSPIIGGKADYSKGNRFNSLEHLSRMPRVRVLGNAVLSLFSKFSTGYWSIMDPTNGFTAIHRAALGTLEFEKLSKGFFFESDMLFRLSLADCVVRDVAMPAIYASETSNLRIFRILPVFLGKHFLNFWKRVVYQYYVREWNLGSFHLPAGVFFTIAGTTFGLASYLNAVATSAPITAGQITSSAFAVLLGAQLLLAFLSYDVQREPRFSRQGEL